MSAEPNEPSDLLKAVQRIPRYSSNPFMAQGAINKALKAAREAGIEPTDAHIVEWCRIHATERDSEDAAKAQRKRTRAEVDSDIELLFGKRRKSAAETQQDTADLFGDARANRSE